MNEIIPEILHEFFEGDLRVHQVASKIKMQNTHEWY